MHTILLLTMSNIFMTIAWYWHLKYKARPCGLRFVRAGKSPSSSIVFKCRRTESDIANSMLSN